MTSLTIAAFLTSSIIPKCLGAETSLEDLVYDYYAAAWDGPQGRLEDALVVTNPDYTDEMATSPDYSAQASEDLSAPPPVKDEFGATLSGMMGALAEIQKEGDSMLAGIRRQREVLNQLEERASLAETRRKEEQAAIAELESERVGLEEKVASMREAEEKMSQTKSALQPLLSEA